MTNEIKQESKKKILYIMSHIDKALEFEWVAKYLDRKFELQFVILKSTSTSELIDFCAKENRKTHWIEYKGKGSIPSAYIKLKKILKSEKPDIVNCHLLEGTVLGLLAAKHCKVKHRIYTRHHSTLHWDFFPKGRKYDRWSNKWATHIIAVSNNVKSVLLDLENIPKKNITVINHCLDLDGLKEDNLAPRIEKIRQKYNIDKSANVIGVISRYTKWKGIQYIIPAFKELLKSDSNAILILANAKKGDHKDAIEALLSGIPKDNYREIVFEKDIQALYGTFKLFIHTPIDSKCEAFGQIYMETMAFKVPMICTKSGIGNEIAIHDKTCLVVDYKNSEDISDAINVLINDEKKREKLTSVAYNMILKEFNIGKKIKSLEFLYNSCN